MAPDVPAAPDPVLMAGAGFQFDFPKARIDWEWTDWLGLVAVIIAAAFFVTVLAAIRSGTPPLKILNQIGIVLRDIVRKK